MAKQTRIVIVAAFRLVIRNNSYAQWETAQNKAPERDWDNRIAADQSLGRRSW
jgi:hypothetical protein